MKRRKEKKTPDTLVQNKLTGQIVTDPQGSYTGRPAIADEVPVQDADDL